MYECMLVRPSLTLSLVRMIVCVCQVTSPGFPELYCCEAKEQAGVAANTSPGGRFLGLSSWGSHSWGVPLVLLSRKLETSVVCVYDWIKWDQILLDHPWASLDYPWTMRDLLSPYPCSVLEVASWFVQVQDTWPIEPFADKFRQEPSPAGCGLSRVRVPPYAKSVSHLPPSF